MCWIDVNSISSAMYLAHNLKSYHRFMGSERLKLTVDWAWSADGFIGIQCECLHLLFKFSLQGVKKQPLVGFLSNSV